eukprot:439473-Ditylum_brightwellii.AAC.1
MDKGVGGLVVGLDLGWLLGVTYCLQERAALCFCCGTNDVFECSALNEYRGIVRCFIVVEGVQIGRTVEIAGDEAFSAIDNKISSVRVDMQLHVSSEEAEYCVW